MRAPLAWGAPPALVTVDVAHRGTSRWAVLHAMQAGRILLEAFGLHVFVIGDAATGGVTNTQYLLGFGRGLGLSTDLTVEVRLPCTLTQVLDGWVEGRF